MPCTQGKTGKNSSVFPKSYGSTTYNAFEIQLHPIQHFVNRSSFSNYMNTLLVVSDLRLWQMGKGHASQT